MLTNQRWDNCPLRALQNMCNIATSHNTVHYRYVKVQICPLHRCIVQRGVIWHIDEMTSGSKRYVLADGSKKDTNNLKVGEFQCTEGAELS
jgi:hypothetical protein